MNLLHSFFRLSLCSLLMLLAACGYQFPGSGTILPPDIQTVAIPIVKNDSTEPGLGLRFTETLRTEFERFGALQVVDNENSADAVLDVTVLGIDTDVKNVTRQTDIELETQVTLRVSAALKRRGGQMLWQNPLMSVSESFASVSDVVVTSSSSFSQGGISSDSLGSLGSREVSRGQLQLALEELIDETSRKIYLDAVAEDF